MIKFMSNHVPITQKSCFAQS